MDTVWQSPDGRVAPRHRTGLVPAADSHCARTWLGSCVDGGDDLLQARRAVPSDPRDPRVPGPQVRTERLRLAVLQYFVALVSSRLARTGS